ncbi:MAG TPA: dihydrolipoamide acetyltransferase family protein, partial [Chloroflexia bacterium]|nr:dihydrolipoamide acetyltransferase family protein [Chloroflexia bacterium]
VEKYESIAEVITDKVNAEIPSPVAGTIRELKVEEGATVPVGTEILTIDDGLAGSGAPAPEPVAESAAPAAPSTPAPAPAEVPSQPSPAPVGASTASTQTASAPSGTDNGRSSELPTDMSAGVAASMPQAQPQMYSAQPPSAASGGSVESEEDLLRRRSTPAVRRLAEEHAVDLQQVTGTGLGGRVTKEDVLQFVAQRGTAPAPASPAASPTSTQPIAAPPVSMPTAAPTPSPVTPAPAPALPSTAMGDVPMGLTPMRRAIAEHMVRSVHTSPHAWTSVEIDMTNLVKYRESIKASFRQREGIDITYLPFFIKAVVDGIKQVPQVNAIWSDEQGVILKREVNIGVPIDIGEGLIVPVIHNADSLSVTGIARRVTELAEKARAGKLTLPEIQGGTITVNNTGALGTVMTHSIINQPQACLVTMESIIKRPVVIDDAIAIRSMMYSVIALDHRILDGGVGARFLRFLKQSLEGFSPDNSGL